MFLPAVRHIATGSLLLLTAACSAPETPVAGPPVAPPAAVSPAAAPGIPVADDFLDSAWFRMARLDTFAVADQYPALVEMTPAQEKRYLQRTAKPYNKYMPGYFYSLQQNTSARQEITVLIYDGEYMSDLWRLVYDARHQLVSRQKVAAWGADGMQRTTQIGWFETPERFRSILRNELGTEDTTFVQYDVDSTVIKYAVELEQFRQVSKQKYQRHYRRPVDLE